MSIRVSENKINKSKEDLIRKYYQNIRLEIVMNMISVIMN